MNHIVVLSLISFGISFVLTFFILKISSANRIGIDERNHVPRIGGLAIIISTLFISLNLIDFDDRLLLPLASATLIALVGLLDDIGLSVSPTLKLIVSLLAALVVVLITDVYVAHINTPIISELFNYKPFAVTVSILALSGLCHGVNLIDGLHGLAISFSISAYVTLAAIRLQIDAFDIATVSICIATASLGLLVFNFPHGYIFMGDVGAYFIGFMSAWISISLCYEYPQVSPWAMVCIFVYPITDVGYVAIRRSLSFRSPMHGDNDHLHHRLQRVFLLRFGDQNRSSRLTTYFCTCLTIFPAALAAINFTKPVVLIAIASASIIIITCLNLIAAMLVRNINS